MPQLTFFNIPSLVIISFIIIYPSPSINLNNKEKEIIYLTQEYLENNKTITDTFPLLVPDYYLITDKMLEKERIINGKTFSDEFVWFTNDSLKQTIIFELYTDYHRLSITHISNDNIPLDLFKTLSEAAGAGYLTTNIDSIKNKIRSADKINRRYFTSSKGIQLGQKKADVIKKYGAADTVINFKDSEMYFWDFTGDAFLSTNKPINNKPYAESSYGFQVKMFFKNNILIAMYLYNDIP